jgi:release factor glutamine methyltransferase
MFVSSNKLSAIKRYFQEKLATDFSISEIKFMFNVAAEERLKIKNAFLVLEDISLSESDLLYFRSIAKRLLAGEPFQQIVGFTEFYGLKIAVTKDVLTPRPETEELVYLVAKDLEQQNKYEPKVLDICSGSGCIALGLKKDFPKGTIQGIEKSKNAIQVAKQNSLELNLPVDFVEKDILTDSWSDLPNDIDIVISNPPYITEREKVLMTATVLEFEPHLALFVTNENPLVFYQKIAEESWSKLKRGGKIYFEINEYFGKETKLQLETLGYQDVQLIIDLQGKQRMLVGTKK